MGHETRKVPTRPGWWWADMSEWHGVDGPPEPLEVYIDDGVAGFDGMFDDQPAEQQVRFLAPIPGPAVLAALSEWFAAHELDCTEAGHQDRFWDAEIALADAIRAERDGGA